MIKLKGNFMFDKVIIRILFNIHDKWNITHIEHWILIRKIKFINIKQESNYYIVNIQKVTKDAQTVIYDLKGEKGVQFECF